MENILSNEWESIKIDKMEYFFNENYINKCVSVDFTVLKSCNFEDLKETSFKNVEFLIEKEMSQWEFWNFIFDKCQEVYKDEENCYHDFL